MNIISVYAFFNVTSLYTISYMALAMKGL